MDKHSKDRRSSSSSSSAKSLDSSSSSDDDKKISKKKKHETIKKYKRDRSRNSSEEFKQRRSDDHRQSKRHRNDERAYNAKNDEDRRDKERALRRRERDNGGPSEYGNKYKNRDSYYQRHYRNDRRSNNYRGRYRDNGSDNYRRNSKDNRPRTRRDRSRSRSFDHSNAKWGKQDQNTKNKDVKKEKEKPNFGLSGKLTEETNTYKGVVIKYSEPPEARKPKRRWRLYPFKGDKLLQTLYIHRESAYLIGRDRKVVDLPIDHPSCSKQHAALQYRLVTFTREDGSTGKRVRPYLIDLESANGTYINNKRIESKKYVELLERDVVKFGFSSREYVLLHENSKDETQDDDVKVEDETSAVKEEPSN